MVQAGGLRSRDHNAPFIPRENSPITLKTLKEAIPVKCFERSALRSFGHLAVDLIELALGYVAILSADPYLVDYPLLRWAVWCVYWFYQGTTMTGLWVLAHECGHGGFSANQVLNDVVGFVLHTALYVPYYAWQLSHAKHHHYTNHMDKDEVYIPERYPEGKTEKGGPSPKASYLQTFINGMVIWTLGWPLYLAINASGPGSKNGKIISHFDPNAPIWPAQDKWKIVLSNFGLVAWTFILYEICQKFGTSLVLWLYVPALLVTNGYLVTITYLQHTHPNVPHYDEGEWNWLRGALCTVDRTMGGFLDYKTHYITSTHVAHHIFSALPFYHANEATEAIKKVLGNYYLADHSNFMLAYWSSVRALNYVEGKGVLHWVMEDH
eukprot:comp20979_c0_seq2/m.28098 comp20979_c0_seq2/g.28098  ORF comp20979_c0_seq2/g.28098 comp20979_c0_seq2/m.28098 type:complete len:380 (-) comp20979_c0_seq2:428-1567(-)